MRWFAVIGVLLLQAILCSANNLCASQSGVVSIPCPAGGHGGHGAGGGHGGKNSVPIETCKEYRYDGPKSQTYEIVNLLPDEKYKILINDLFVVLDDVITVRKFWCKFTFPEPEECAYYRLDRNAWPPFMLNEGHHKKFCVNGGKHSILKFKVVTEDCDKCHHWGENYSCKEPEACTRDGGMYLKKDLGYCPGTEVCCLVMPCHEVHCKHGKRCVPRPDFPKECPAHCRTVFPCPQGENCCDLCEHYGEEYTCVKKGTCKEQKKLTNSCCPNDDEECCHLH